MSIVQGTIQHAYRLQAEWQAWDGIPLAGQLCYSSDVFYGTTNCPKFKTGNGIDTWSNLDYHPDAGSSGVQTLSNGLTLTGTNGKLGGSLVNDTTIAAGAFDYKVTSVPEVGKTAEYEASQDLFGLLALVGKAINGQGNRYVLTYDGGGDPESWLFQKVSNDTTVGGTYNSSIGYINISTGIECYLEVTTAGLQMVTRDGTNRTGLTVTQATEIIEAVVNGVTKLYIDSNGVTVSNLTSAGDRLVFANLNGLLGIKTSAQATAMLDNMVGDSGAGGTKGLVPAPAAGDAAASKFLKADGTWDTAGGASTTIFFKSFTTVSSSAGLGISADCVFFGSIMIPAGTVAAGDIIKVSTMQRSNGVSTGGAGWALRDGSAAPLAATVPNTADANGFKTFVAYLNQTGVFHCGMEHYIRATQPGCYAPGSSTTAGNVLTNNSIIHHMIYQSTNITPYTDSNVDWANTDYYIVFFHRAAVATTMTHLLSTVEIMRPQ